VAKKSLKRNKNLNLPAICGLVLVKSAIVRVFHVLQGEALDEVQLVSVSNLTGLFYSVFTLVSVWTDSIDFI
jgi:hypothetical protein